MRVTILGCGASTGVPVVGCSCAVCLSPNPKNRRLRVSVLVKHEGASILIDTSPDLREQCLRFAVGKIDAILYTHAHADHTHGIDEVKALNGIAKAPIDCCGDAATLESLATRFNYAFQPPNPEFGWYRPCLTPHVIEKMNEPFNVEGADVIPIELTHGRSKSLGYRIGKMAYTTDTDNIPESSWPQLEGLDLWVVDCLRYEKAPTHAHLPMTLEWIARAKPRRAVLTHMAHEFDYDKLRKELPKGVEPGFDGMVIEL